MNPHHGPRMFSSGALIILGLVVACGGNPAAALAQTGAPKIKADKNGITPPPEDVNYLSMEVNALRTLYLLRGSDPDLTVGTQHPEERLKIIKKFSTCAQKEEKKRRQADVSDAYRKVLVELRAALIAEQEEQIEKLDKKLRDLQKAEDPDLDDQVEITDEARRRTVYFMRYHIAADQVIAYLGSYGKDLPNPRALLFKAMRIPAKGGPKAGPDGPKPSPEEWKEIRAFTIREVTWQLGGLSLNKGDTFWDRVSDLLDRAYAMSDAELNKNLVKLRTEALVIVDAVLPTDLIRHVFEQDVAEMLSNPRLVPAAEARLTYLAAKKKQ